MMHLARYELSLVYPCASKAKQSTMAVWSSLCSLVAFQLERHQYVLPSKSQPDSDLMQPWTAEPVD